MGHRVLSASATAVVALTLVAGMRPASGERMERRIGAESEGTKVVLLGTGTPNADPDRSGPAVAIVVNGTPYLVDCGPGVVRRAAAAQRNGIAGLASANLRRVFITHLHSDHTVGCPDLLLSTWVLGRNVPLEVYGPEGTAHMMHHIIEAFREDIRMRIYGAEPRDAQGYKANVTEVEPGLVYEDENVRVHAFRVVHGSWPNAYGYRFETADRTVVISGDAAPSASVVEACSGCDVLIHEVVSAEGLTRRPEVWQHYHSTYHTTTTELARIANQARPGLLILYHQLPQGRTDEELVQEITRLYDGRVVSGRDLDVY